MTRNLRRAGLDYHEFAGVQIYQNWEKFTEQAEPGEFLVLSTKGTINYTEADFQADDYLVFGPETRGLPDEIRGKIGKERLLRIPMLPNSRSLNLSNAAAVVVYEAWRQLGFSPGE